MCRLNINSAAKVIIIFDVAKEIQKKVPSHRCVTGHLNYRIRLDFT